MSSSNLPPSKSIGLPSVDQILGLALFDPLGIPCDYFITSQYQDTDWVQIAFQALGLQQLIATAMELTACEHAMIRAKAGNIVMIRYGQGYIALFIKRALPQEFPIIDSDWIAWICDFESRVVRTHPNFKAV